MIFVSYYYLQAYNISAHKIIATTDGFSSSNTFDFIALTLLPIIIFDLHTILIIIYHSLIYITGIIRLMEPYDSNTMSSTTSKKTVRFKDQAGPKLSSESMRSTTSSDNYTGISTTDDEVDTRRSTFVRETSRSSKRGSG